MTRQDRILVVDDDTTITTALRVKLERAGFAVSVAFDGREAWELLAEEPFDFVVVDEKMPRMNGTELCQRIREDPRLMELPILMITAKLLEMDREGLVGQFGLVDVIGKPFSPRAVASIAANHLTSTPAAT